ncbi:MAG: glycosyltransferase family 4 protein [Candidatus Phosphoribacter sp.]|nr:glycosyltransferase family 4 protein [Actinomycetales bacterium]
MLESVSALRGIGAEVLVVCPMPGELTIRIGERNARVLHLRFPVIRRAYWSPGGMVRLCAQLVCDLPQMIRLIRRERPNIIYVNTTAIPWWILAARMTRTPVVCHVHEAESHDNRRVLWALNAPLLFATRLILISKTSAEATFNIFPRLSRTSAIVMNGVPDRENPPVSPPDGVPTRLSVVSRLSPRKGVHTAIAAVAILRQHGHDVQLEIAGSTFSGYEWYEAQLRSQVAELGLEEFVSFSGYVSPSTMVFDRSDIVIAPSEREPFGNAVVEAQLAERPVVAAAAGGHLESITDGWNGLLVGVERPAEFADAVLRLLADRTLRETIAVHARQSALERFGLTRYRKEIVDVLSRALPESKRAASGG